jgi:hypothetical protein
MREPLWFFSRNWWHAHPLLWWRWNFHFLFFFTATIPNVKVVGRYSTGKRKEEKKKKEREMHEHHNPAPPQMVAKLGFRARRSDVKVGCGTVYIARHVHIIFVDDKISMDAPPPPSPPVLKPLNN